MRCLGRGYYRGRWELHRKVYKGLSQFKDKLVPEICRGQEECNFKKQQSTF